MENNKLSFEDMLARLEQISKLLQSNDLQLEKAIEIYKESVTLSKSAEQQLNEAELKILVIGENNEIKVFESKLTQIFQILKIEIVDCKKAGGDISTILANLNIKIVDLYNNN